MNPYLPLIFLFGFVGFLGALILGLSHLLGRPHFRPEQATTYECGLPTVGSSHNKFHVRFYLVAMLFILFDVEVVFLYPWAILFKEFTQAGQGLFLFIEMLIFLAILFIGLVYIYGRRAIEWE